MELKQKSTHIQIHILILFLGICPPASVVCVHCTWALPCEATLNRLLLNRAKYGFDFVEINWSLSLHWLKAAEHYRVDSEGSAGMTVGWPPVGCGWVPEACYLHPWLLWEPVLGGRLLGQGTAPRPMLGLYLLFRSALPPCLVLWGVALSRWEELNLHCVFFFFPHIFIVILV